MSAIQGRKNVHGKAGVRFKAAYTASKRKNMLRNVVTELVIHEKVIVTSGVAQEVKTLADHLVTLAKRGDLHARRQAASILRKMSTNEKESVSALDKLFDELGPSFKARNGGYTRAIKADNRRGDNAKRVLVSWVR